MEENQNLLNNKQEENQDKSEELMMQDEEALELDIGKKIRKGFISKVYFLLASQLFIAFFFVFLANEIKSIKIFLIIHFWLYLLISLIPLGILIFFLFCPEKLKQVPLNYILLFIFSICEGYFVARFSIQYQKSSVYMAMLLTLVSVITLSIYASITKKDFTTWGGLLWASLLLLLFGSILVIFFKISLLKTILQVCGIALFSLYLIYDTQLIIGNMKYKLSEDDYIIGVINLYLDIINLFIYILSIMGSKN